MLVLHDDAKREYAYGPATGLLDTKVGTFTQALYDEAQKNGWTVISMWIVTRESVFAIVSVWLGFLLLTARALLRGDRANNEFSSAGGGKWCLRAFRGAREKCLNLGPVENIC